MPKRVLFLDRDGVIFQEAPPDFQLDALEKITFLDGVISNLGRISKELDFFKVLITNQDGLGTDAFPENSFWPYQDLMLRTLDGEGFVFDEIHINNFNIGNNIMLTAEVKHLLRFRNSADH